MTLAENDRMTQMISGYWITQIVHAAAVFSLADHLADGPATSAAIAAKAGADPTAIFRLLRACVTLDLVAHEDERRFSARPLLNTLRTDNPQSLKALAMVMAGSANWLTWGRFVEAVRTGQPQAKAALGKPVFEYIAEQPAEAEAFAQAMKSTLAFVSAEVARLLDTRSATLVADIGGAGGALLHAVLERNPALNGIVFDLPDIAAIARSSAAEAGLERRVTAIGGDFLDAVPAADLYLLRYILHDWDDASCVRILTNCRRAMARGGRVAVIERLLGEMGDARAAALMDLNMMAVLGGRERDQSEYEQLFAAAGLRLTRVTPTGTPSATILEAIDAA
jgi:hypothetical protein